jgi:hypothetical protein
MESSPTILRGRTDQPIATQNFHVFSVQVAAILPLPNQDPMDIYAGGPQLHYVPRIDDDNILRFDYVEEGVPIPDTGAVDFAIAVSGAD